MTPRAQTILLLSLLIAIGFVAQKYARVISRLFGLKGESLVGIEFILIGMLLGPHGLNLITSEAFDGLFPIFSLALGWIGLTMMIEMDFRTVTRIPFRLAGISLLASLITLGVVYSLFSALLPDFASKLNWALILGLLAIPVAPEMIASQMRNFKHKSKDLHQVLTLGILDDFHSILMYSILFPFLVHAYTGMDFLRLLLLGLLVGGICGVILNLLTIPSRKRSELLLILIGTVFLASGLSGMLNISPLFTNATCGVVVANSSFKRLRMADVLQKAERPVFFFFLLLVGLLLDLEALYQSKMVWAGLIIACLFILFRFIGKFVGYWLSTQFNGPVLAATELTFIGQSGIFIAILVDLRLAIAGPESNELLFTGILAFILNSLLLHLVIRYKIKKIQHENIRF